MRVSFSHVSHAVYIFAYIDSLFETTLQFASVSQLNVCLGQTRSQVWRFGGAKTF